MKNECGACGELEHTRGETCSNGGQGPCAKPGVYVCMGETTICNAPSAVPSAEVCDNTDNDCDGMVDEGITKNACMGCADLAHPPKSACQDGEGECKVAGTWECMGTEAVVCTAKAKSPGAEICDSKDNDCNGVADDGCMRNACGGWTRLANAKGSQCAGSGACASTGTYECQGTDATTCNAAAKPLNACGGCAQLANSKGAPCTTGQGMCAATGTYQCMGTESTVCNAKVTFPNLIQDPGFEQQSSFAVNPPWTNFMGAQIETAGNAHDGSKNSSVTAMSGNSTSVAGWNDIFQRIQVQPNARYKLQAWVKTSANTADLKIGARDGTNWKLELGGRVYGALASYTLLSTEFVAASASADVYVGLHEGADGSATTFKLDDVSVTLQAVCP